MRGPTRGTIWVDGRWQLASAPAVRADDAGLLYGLGAFETVWIRAGRPVGLSRHLARLATALSALAIAYPLQPMADALRALARLSPEGEWAGRLVVTGGPPTVGEAAGSAEAPRPIGLVSVRALPAHVPRRRLGVHGTTVADLARTLPQLKSLAWLPSLIAQRQVPPGHEAIFVDADGHLLEGATTNLYWLKGQTLTTPAPPQVLPGVVRQWITERAATLGLQLNLAPIPLAALHADSELFVSNALLPIAPLRAINGQPLAAPSALQRALLAGYEGQAHAL